MDENILFICNEKGFLTNVIIRNLTGCGFGVIRIEAEIKDIEAHRDDMNLIILYLDKYILDEKQILECVRSVTVERARPVCLIGTPDEIRIAKTYIPEELTFASFERPLDVKKLIHSVQSMSQVSRSGEKKSILLVDDDGDFLKMARSWLSPKYEVTIVSSGMQAITYLATKLPDLILLDHEMPVTSGAQVMEMIRSDDRTAGIPIIFLTGKSDREHVMNIMALKPQGYLLKSMTRDEITERVDRFFEIGTTV